MATNSSQTHRSHATNTWIEYLSHDLIEEGMIVWNSNCFLPLRATDYKQMIVIEKKTDHLVTVVIDSPESFKSLNLKEPVEFKDQKSYIPIQGSQPERQPIIQPEGQFTVKLEHGDIKSDYWGSVQTCMRVFPDRTARKYATFHGMKVAKEDVEEIKKQVQASVFRFS